MAVRNAKNNQGLEPERDGQGYVGQEMGVACLAGPDLQRRNFSQIEQPTVHDTGCMGEVQTDSEILARRNYELSNYNQFQVKT